MIAIIFLLAGINAFSAGIMIGEAQTLFKNGDQLHGFFILTLAAGLITTSVYLQITPIQ